MKTKDCKTVAGFIAMYSREFEGYFEEMKRIEEKKDCKKSKDSAKEFDKTIYKLINKVIKRNKDFNFSEEDYRDISKIACIYKKFEDSDKSEYDKKYKAMRSDYYSMENSMYLYNYNKDGRVDAYRTNLQSLSGYKIQLSDSKKEPFFKKGNMDKFVDALDPDNLKKS